MQNNPLPNLGASPQVGESGQEPPNVTSPLADTFGEVIYQTPLVDHASGPVSVQEAVARYLMLRVAEGVSEKSDTYRHFTKHLSERLCAAFGKMELRSVKADHLRMWAGSLKNDRTGKPLEMLTVRHHLIAVKTFFRRCWREGWIERDPTLPLVLPQIEEKDVNVIAVRDAFEFFRVNRDHRSIGRLALEAFGGLRYTSAGKIRREDIRWERRGIEMPSTKHKSRKRKFRQGHPACLWEWLRHAPAEGWDLDLRQYREDKREMLVLSRMRPMVLKTDADREKARTLKNVWRHSFASYLLAKAKEYAPIAYLMQHARATTTEVYEGVADEFDALLYFAITPRSVLLSWEDFCASITPPKNEPLYAESPMP